MSVILYQSGAARFTRRPILSMKQRLKRYRTIRHILPLSMNVGLAEVMILAFSIWWANLFTGYFVVHGSTLMDSIKATGYALSIIILLCWVMVGSLTYSIIIGRPPIRRVVFFLTTIFWFLITGVLFKPGPDILTQVAAIISVSSLTVFLRIWLGPISPPVTTETLLEHNLLAQEALSKAVDTLSSSDKAGSE